MADQPVIIAMIADVPAEGITAFQAYESQVLPLLDRHHGRLERRLRTPDSRVEVHILSFDSRQGYQDYLADPQRLAHRHLLAGVEPTQRILEVSEVATAPH